MCYVSKIIHAFPVMNEKEKQKLAAIEHQNKALIKQLEEAQMKNIILKTLIDVAEEELKIIIRKKPGSKLLECSGSFTISTGCIKDVKPDEVHLKIQGQAVRKLKKLFHYFLVGRKGIGGYFL